MKLNMNSDNQKHSFPGGGLISVAGFTHIPMLYDAVPANHVILRTLSLGCPYVVHATLCWLTNLTELELVLCPQTFYSGCRIQDDSGSLASGSGCTKTRPAPTPK